MQFKLFILPIFVALVYSPTQVAAESADEAWKQVGAVLGVGIAAAVTVSGGVTYITMRADAQAKADRAKLNAKIDSIQEELVAIRATRPLSDMESTLEKYVDAVKDDMTTTDGIMAEKQHLTQTEFDQSAIPRSEMNNDFAEISDVKKDNSAAWASKGAAMKKLLDAAQPIFAKRKTAFNKWVQQQQAKKAVKKWRTGVEAAGDSKSSAASTTATSGTDNTVAIEEESTVIANTATEHLSSAPQWQTEAKAQEAAKTQDTANKEHLPSTSEWAKEADTQAAAKAQEAAKKETDAKDALQDEAAKSDAHSLNSQSVWDDESTKVPSVRSSAASFKSEVASVKVL